MKQVMVTSILLVIWLILSGCGGDDSAADTPSRTNYDLVTESVSGFDQNQLKERAEELAKIDDLLRGGNLKSTYQTADECTQDLTEVAKDVEGVVKRECGGEGLSVTIPLFKVGDVTNTCEISYDSVAVHVQRFDQEDDAQNSILKAYIIPKRRYVQVAATGGASFQEPLWDNSLGSGGFLQREDFGIVEKVFAHQGKYMVYLIPRSECFRNNIEKQKIVARAVLKEKNK